MTHELLELILSLKEDPVNSGIDHLEILDDIYMQYIEGKEEFKLLAAFYCNGLENIPKLSEKGIWNNGKFNALREPFFEVFPRLVELVNLVTKPERMKRQKYRERYSKALEMLFYHYIDKVFWEDWDPIGINDVAPRDEYRGYIPPIHKMLLEGGAHHEIGAKLYSIQKENMEYLEGKETCLKIGIKLVAFRENNQPK